MRTLRRQRKPQHPTPQEAHALLAGGCCMYAALTACSGKPRPSGLRHDEDEVAVLVCKAHYGRLRKLSEREADTLEHFLSKAFNRVPAREEGAFFEWGFSRTPR